MPRLPPGFSQRHALSRRSTAKEDETAKIFGAHKSKAPSERKIIAQGKRSAALGKCPTNCPSPVGATEFMPSSFFSAGDLICNICKINRDCDLVRSACIQTPPAHSLFRVSLRSAIKTTSEATALRTGHHSKCLAGTKCFCPNRIAKASLVVFKPCWFHHRQAK